MLSYEKALRLLIDRAVPVGIETVPLARAAGRLLARPIRADRDLPPFSRSERDGWAVRAADLPGGAGLLAWDGAVLFAGDEPRGALGPGSCVKIMTGAPLPGGADAVVMVERSRAEGGAVAVEERGLRPSLHVHGRGADARAGEELLPAGVPLSPGRIAVAASVGAREPSLFRRVRVSILVTGDELVPADRLPGPAEVRECNGSALGAMIEALPWLERVSARLVEDDVSSLGREIETALASSDALVLSGGVSMGEKDLVPAALEACGVRELLHKVAVRPGKPFWAGAAGEDRLVLGLPGNPVSAQVVFRELGLAALRKMAGFASPAPPSLSLPAAERIEKEGAMHRFLPARLVVDGGRSAVKPLRHHGSGDFVGVSGADGVALLPEGSVGIERGEVVSFHPWSLS